MPSGGDEPDLVEPGLFAGLLGENQVAEMDRVERPAEDADTHRTTNHKGHKGHRENTTK